MMISVIVPVYNCAPYIERCIRSILVQTYPYIEIICIDDGSTDSSGEILESLAREDARVHVVHQKNAGAAAARNTGINMASGEFITFVDSDDAIEMDMYEAMLPFFDDRDIDIVHCGYKRMYRDGSYKDVNGSGKIVRQSRYEAIRCLLSGNLFVGSLCNKIFRATLLQGTRLDASLSINEDVLANAVLFNKAKGSIFWDIGKYLAYEREGSTSSATETCKRLSECVIAAEKMLLIFIGTPAEQAAEGRLINMLILLYRWYTMNGLTGRNEESNALSMRISDLLNRTNCTLNRKRMEYKVMRYAPSLYRIVYGLYDKIREPNWDANLEE